jgi:hypothetical protein
MSTTSGVGFNVVSVGITPIGQHLTVHPNLD